MRKRKGKKVAGALLVISMIAGATAPASIVYADSTRVVTLGADLSEERQASILKYFGVNKSSVETIYVNNSEERALLSSFVPLDVIGTRTLSCAYVNPTNSGGIQVKTANLTWVTSNMIASALSTSGVRNCEVIAACPIPVSGTGALAGVMKAYERASGEVLDATKKEIAAQEIVTTGDIAEVIGQDAATQIVNDIKISVIEDAVEVYDDALIQEIIDEAVQKAVDEIQDERDELVELSAKQREELQKLAESIAAQQYDYDDVKETLKRVEQNVNGLNGKGDVNVNVNVTNENTANGGNATNENTANGGNATAETGDAIAAASNEDTAGGDNLAEDSILVNTDISALGEDVITDATTVEAYTQDDVQTLVNNGETDLPFEILQTEESVFGGETSDNQETVIPDAQPVEQPAQEMQPAEEQPYVEEQTGVEEVPVTEVLPEATEVIPEATDEIPEATGETFEFTESYVDETENFGNETTTTDEPLEEDWTADEPPIEETAAETVNVAFGGGKQFNGFSLKLYTDEEVVPASGTIELTNDMGESYVLDLADYGAYGMLPVEDYDIVDSLGWDEVFAIHVFTNKLGLAGGTYHAVANVVFADCDEDGRPVAGSEKPAVTAEADLTYVASSLVPSSDSNFTAPSVATITAYAPEGTVSGEVYSSDEAVAIPEGYMADEGVGYVNLDLEETGETVVTVMFYDGEGQYLGEDSLTIAVF